MSIFATKKDPIARIQQLLIEKKLAWLWAVKSDWRSTDRVEIRTMTDRELDWCTSHDDATMISFCHAHLETAERESVLRIDFDHANAQWFEAMKKIGDSGSLWCLKHLVSISEDGSKIQVWKAPKDQSLKQVFMSSHRSKD